MPLCSLSGNWNQVNKAIQTALESVSLAEMMPRPFPFEPTPEELAK
jgi:DNA-binding IscR family transcriptional regulator